MRSFNTAISCVNEAKNADSNAFTAPQWPPMDEAHVRQSRDNILTTIAAAGHLFFACMIVVA
jgi:hypothetical protein